MPGLRTPSVALATLLLVAGCGVEPPGDLQATAVATSESDPSLRVILRTDQQDRIVNGSFPVETRSRTRRSVRATLELRAARGASIRSTHAAQVRRGRSRVELVLSPDQRALLERCRLTRVSVALERRAGGRRLVARRSADLMLAPPACGRFFARDSIWNSRIPVQTRLDQDDRPVTEDLVRQVREMSARKFGPSFNTSRFSSPIYVAARDTPTVPVVLDRPQKYADKLRGQFAAGVPIPQEARPSDGNDAHMVIWQPSTDRMWEFFEARKEGSTWHADWGGRMEAVSKDPGYFYDRSGTQPGATATSLPLVGGLVTLAELRRGRIDHALALAIPQPRRSVWSLPAQRTDGFSMRPFAVPEGARFQLDPSLDVDALPMSRAMKVIARAAQRYGMYVRDVSGTITLYGEGPQPYGGGDPYKALFGPVSVPEQLRAFPWDRLRLLPMELRTFNHGSRNNGGIIER